MGAGYVLPVTMVPKEIDALQVVLFGNIFYFNWQDPTEVSVVWSLRGYGEYVLPAAYGFGDQDLAVNTAVDVYINE